ncbi:MAG: 23S rRNA (guanosine(2251)-2'-O)-methyltransferase RlmB [Bacilli bacterium]|nr:23S rRNA (guanosine(2251)-2'-O)-methyltransferase RlmB [Bacilli bacterium]
MYIFGKNVAREKINSGEKINKIYISDKFRDKEIFNLIKKKKIKYSIVPNKFLDNKVDGMHQGIIIDVDDVNTFDFDYIKNIDKDNPVIVMLDHLEDPHNFGAIIRTCEALGIDGIIIPNDRNVGINATVVKTSAGAIYNIPIIRVANLTSTIEKLKGIGYWIVGTDMSGENYKEIDYNMPVCLIIGNEGKGISDIVRKNCDYIASIPMIGKINSLNASVTCGIMLAEIVYGRGK